MSALNQAVSIDAVMDLGASYAECLRTMNAAFLRGITFRMDPSLESVLGLQPEHLELFIGMAQDFNKQECLERCTRSRENGTVFGRPQKILPENFLMAAKDWAEGRTNLRDAAKRCSMHPATFRLHVERAGILPDKDIRKNGKWPLPAAWVQLVRKLLREEITLEAAALTAGLSVKSFKKRLHLHRDELRQLAPQALLDACRAWSERKCTRKEAALQAGYRQEVFQALLKVFGYERYNPGPAMKNISRNDNAQKGVSIQ